MIVVPPDVHERTRHLVQRVDELEKTVAAYRGAIEEFLAAMDTTPDRDWDCLPFYLLERLRGEAW